MSKYAVGLRDHALVVGLVLCKNYTKILFITEKNRQQKIVLSSKWLSANPVSSTCGLGLELTTWALSAQTDGPFGTLATPIGMLDSSR
jgi:hypothetical protein